MDLKYYLVFVKCGHVRKSQYVVKCFPICAPNGKIAARIARLKSRVKHHDKYAIKEVREVSKDEYYEQVKIFADDNFHKIHSVQEQRALCPDIYLEAHKEEESETYKRTNIRRRLVDNQIAKEMEKDRREYDY